MMETRAANIFNLIIMFHISVWKRIEKWCRYRWARLQSSVWGSEIGGVAIARNVVCVRTTPAGSESYGLTTHSPSKHIVSLITNTICIVKSTDLRAAFDYEKPLFAGKF